MLRRYLQPSAKALGLEFPDRIAKIMGHPGQVRSLQCFVSASMSGVQGT